MAEFAGVPPAAFAFLRGLSANQAKAWFVANQPAYERTLRQPLAALVEAVATDFAAAGIPLTGDPRRSLFRINRDVRFSRDKSPYKTNAGAIWFRPGSGKNASGVLYLHVADEGCFAAAAFHRPDRDVLGSIREGIRMRPEAFMAVVAELGAARLALDATDSLSRMPRGFEDMAGAPVAPFLRLRSFVVSRPLTKRQLGQPAVVQALAGFAQEAMPLLRFGWRAVEEAAGP